MATTKSKKTTTKKSSTKPKAAETKSAKTVKAEAAATSKNVAKTSIKSEKTRIFKGFFAKKSDPNENILTIFKSHKIWGALLGELAGTMFLSILLLTLGIYQPLYVMFGVIGITMAVYALSGAHINPAVTVGMMATRRVSAIRGVLYIVAQVIGAWFGLLIVNAFRMAGGEAVELTAMAELTSDTMWTCAFIELIGAIIIGYFFCRAQHYRSPKGAFTYGAMVAGGITIAIILGIVVSSNFFNGMQNNFAMNPAIAIMYQIFPNSADGFGALMGSVALAAFVYIIMPMIGSVLGFFFADLSSRLAGEEQ